ncbi:MULTISPECIES: hypothetical protein [Thermococcus]|uniref:TRP-repeat-containing protein n=1 Tax=Thermococcus sibiricus (strain DSM 12597 / MM 739) TaxID=604354 RepID=C6A150_THESM|nr:MULTISPECIES: hypothetical protein [Thermococcus]ACS89345.1 hypothetical protein TSIB_0279 [Thermococcus sibiricus MM 739]MBC7095732.1 hypothetical protein [Thermococcus sp.]
MEKEELAISIFKEAQKTLKDKKLDVAKEKFENIIRLTEDPHPWLYFEACFGLVKVYIEKEDYKSAMDSAFKALLHAPNQEVYLLGVERVRSILAIIKKSGRLSDLTDSFHKIEDKNEELYYFSKALNALARENYKEVYLTADKLKTDELKNILYSLLED